MTGFSLAEIDFIIDDAAAANPNGPDAADDAVPESNVQVVSRLGDLWSHSVGYIFTLMTLSAIVDQSSICFSFGLSSEKGLRRDQYLEAMALVRVIEKQLPPSYKLQEWQ